MIFTRVVSVFLLILSSTCLADIPYLSLEERTVQAFAVISGEIVSIVPINISGEKLSRKIAIVKVDTVEKGTIESAFVLVSVGIVTTGSFKSSQEVELNVKDTGRWLLNYDKSGLFILNRPDDFIATLN